MKSLSLIVAAALLLVLSNACNQGVGKTHSVEALNRRQSSQEKLLKVQDQALVQKEYEPAAQADREKAGPADSVDFNREEYAHIEENRFLGARQEPLSTFSIDVDAAS